MAIQGPILPGRPTLSVAVGLRRTGGQRGPDAAFDQDLGVGHCIGRDGAILTADEMLVSHHAGVRVGHEADFCFPVGTESLAGLQHDRVVDVVGLVSLGQEYRSVFGECRLNRGIPDLRRHGACRLAAAGIRPDFGPRGRDGQRLEIQHAAGLRRRRNQSLHRSLHAIADFLGQLIGWRCLSRHSTGEGRCPNVAHQDENSSGCLTVHAILQDSGSSAGVRRIGPAARALHAKHLRFALAMDLDSVVLSPPTQRWDRLGSPLWTRPRTMSAFARAITPFRGAKATNRGVVLGRCFVDGILAVADRRPQSFRPVGSEIRRPEPLPGCQ